MAEGVEGNGYVDPAAVEPPPIALPAAERGPDIFVPDIRHIAHEAERAAVRRFAYPFVRLVADEA